MRPLYTIEPSCSGLCLALCNGIGLEKEEADRHKYNIPAMGEAQRATSNGFHWNRLISTGKEGRMTALKVICQIDDQSEDRLITVVSRIGPIIVSIKQLIAFVCVGKTV